MSSALVVNSTNAIQNSNGTYSVFQYKFPSNTSMDNMQLLPSIISFPFSNFNFRSDTYQNTTYQIIWIDGTVATISMPSGYYAASDLNNFLQEYMISKTWYTINNATGPASGVTFNYYLQIQENQTYYAIQLNSVPVPTAAQAAAAGITQPAGATWNFPLTPTNPQFTILAPPSPPNQYNTSFSNSIGFNAQTWPASQTSPGIGQSILSNFTPQINPVSTIVVLCSLINNRFASQNNVLYAFNTGDTQFGAYFTINVPQEIWLNCSRGMFADFTLTFVDQTLRNLVPLQDPTVLTVLSLRDTPTDLRALALKRETRTN